MGGNVKIEIGTSAWEMGRRFIEAWHAAERGEHREPQCILIYEDPDDAARAAERMTAREQAAPSSPHPSGDLAPQASTRCESWDERFDDD